MLKFMVIGMYFLIVVSQGWAQETKKEEIEKLRQKLHEEIEELKEEKPKENKKIEEKKKISLETYLDGKNDGEKIVKSENIVSLYGGGAGLLLGPIGYLGYVLVKTEPPYSTIESIKDKSENYQLGFCEGYKNKRKSQYLNAVTTGMIVGLGIGVIRILISGELFYFLD